MNLAEIAERTHFWQRFRRALVIFWQPLILLAVIPTIVTLATCLPFAVNFFSLILPLFGMAAYLAYKRFGITGLASVTGVFLLGFLLSYLKIQPIEHHATAQNYRSGDDTVSLLVLLAIMIVFFGVAYLAGRLSGGEGGMFLRVIVLVTLAGLLALSALNFS